VAGFCEYDHVHSSSIKDRIMLGLVERLQSSHEELCSIQTVN
jgi:hypothetical protein